MSTIPLNLNGYTDLPPGKIANVVTYLALAVPSSQPPPEPPRDLAVRRVAHPEPKWFRDIYRRIGQDLLWFSAEMMSDEQLAREIAAPKTTVLSLERGTETIGLAELRFGEGDSVEIVSFGVVPESTGAGAGHVLMDAALAHAFSHGAKRVWLHTCSFDHPGAIRFYLKRGFHAFKYAIEVVDDPRLTGLLPPTAAPQVPIVAPGTTAIPGSAGTDGGG